MIVQDVSKTIQIPFEPGTSVTIRKPSWKELKAANKVQQAESVEGLKLFGAELLKAIISGRTAQESADLAAKAQAAQEAMVSNYDRDSMLKTCIVSWSYALGVTEGIAKLDEAVAAYLHEQTVLYGRESVAEKNGLSSSTAPSTASSTPTARRNG